MKKIYLKRGTIVVVERHQVGELNPDLIGNEYEMTLEEAIKTGQMDTCSGTMTYRIDVKEGQIPELEHAIEQNRTGAGREIMKNKRGYYVDLGTPW